jgi:basic membrane protein A and related proteins
MQIKNSSRGLKAMKAERIRSLFASFLLKFAHRISGASMKFTHGMISLLVAAMLLPACGSAVDVAPDCKSPDVFCVGVVTDVGKIDDKSFNQSAWEGAKQAEENLGAIVNYIETTDSVDYDKNLETFGEAGYDVIVSVGFALGKATRRVASAYPDTNFIGVDQPQDISEPGPINLVGLVFPEDQAGFLVGALAAQISTTKKIGAVCVADSIQTFWKYGEGYRAGAAYEDAESGTQTEVTVVYHNDVGFDETFVDPIWGANTANEMIDAGVDVIFGCGGETGNGAVSAAAQRGVYTIGVETDQFFTLPDDKKMLLSSAIKLITPGVFDLIKMAKDGEFPSGNYYGTAGYAPFHALDRGVPAEVKTKMEQIAQGLIDGSIETKVPPVKP